MTSRAGIPEWIRRPNKKMATKKKNSPEIETAAKAEATSAAKTKSVKTRAAQAAPAAATHKSPARKATVRKPAAKAAAAAAQPEAARGFDVAAHAAEIERVAYFLWLDRGAGHGAEGEDWARAVEIVRARQTEG